MSEEDPLSWLDGELEDIGERFAKAKEVWPRHIPTEREDVEEAAAVHATLLAAQMASVRWCVKALRREGVSEQALGPLSSLIGSLDLLLDGRADSILNPVRRPVAPSHRRVGSPGTSGRDRFHRAIAVYASRLLSDRKIKQRIEADIWVSKVLRGSGLDVAAKTIGDWRRDPEHHLTPSLAQEVTRMLAAVPTMGATQLEVHLRSEIRAAISN